MQQTQRGRSVNLRLLAAATVFVIALAASPVVFGQSSYTVTDLGTISNGGIVTGNQYVFNYYGVGGVTTPKIRILVNANAFGDYSRIVEVEAHNSPFSNSNIALASQGATATASSTHSSGYLPVAAINGDRKGLHLGTDPATGSAWTDGTWGTFPDWLQIDFNGSKTIYRIVVVTIQDDYMNPVEPGQNLKFQTYGITNFQVQYWNGSTFVDLPNIATSRAWKINNSGVVVGESGSETAIAGSAPSIATKWENGVATNLGGFAGSNRWTTGRATSINSAGVIAGSSWDAVSGQEHPFRWTAGTMLDLGGMGGSQTWGLDINDAATVQISGAGEVDPNTLADQAFVWSSPTGKVNIARLPGGTTNLAFGLNNFGHVVGRSNKANFETHAFRKIGLGILDLGTLGGTFSSAQDISEGGVTIGGSSTASSQTHAFAHSDVGGMIDLGTLSGGTWSWALGVNNAGVIVGTSITSSTGERAFVYDSVNGLRNLNTLTSGSGWTLTRATSVNAGGQIVGWGINPSGIERGFLLTPNLNGVSSNQALASNGATAVASSTFSLGNTAAATINGDRKGLNWGTNPLAGSGWQCSTANVWGDTLQVNFAGKRIISQINVITAQTDVFNPVEPTLSTTFSANGITAYQVQYWDGVNWVNVPGANVTGNDKVWRQFNVTPFVTDKIRVLVNNGNTHSRIVELEAWGTML